MTSGDDDGKWMTHGLQVGDDGRTRTPVLPAGSDDATGDSAPTAGGRSGPDGARSRRHDPRRRERLIDTALGVIAEHGVAGTTHRRVAAAADVPLGSMTYHFDGMDDLLHAAFTALAGRTADTFDAALSGAATRDEAGEAVVGLITGTALNAPDTMLASLELYALAARRPEFRTITDAWMARSRDALHNHFDPETALMLDALIEGTTLHRALSLNPMKIGTIRTAVERIIRP
ncbi:DNA-binding transcriptional regulator YbjK [Arthrobacter sp. PL16]|uniref:TetR/AcrR family transcriptional regulator n=1 Tax=Arthrobacter sp. PL16 TaxID=3071720 RepID=UPI002DFCD0D5|nr:DNA-binding transcriptional regulator YbjK [Arthrobacter sp. PL16]